jgi:hypothetical protein
MREKPLFPIGYNLISNPIPHPINRNKNQNLEDKNKYFLNITGVTVSIYIFIIENDAQENETGQERMAVA